MRIIITCAVYLLLGWGTLQLGNIVIPAMGYDASVFSHYFTYLCLFGFPVIFAMAWFSRGTPEDTVDTVDTDDFVERRVLSNIAPINDQRKTAATRHSHQGEGPPEYHWIVSAETGPLTGLSFGITEHVVLGRALDCDIAIVSPHLARQHARLELDDSQQLYVEDLGSSNGTVVNGKPVQLRQALQHGDELRFYDIIFRVKKSESDSPGAKAP